MIYNSLSNRLMTIAEEFEKNISRIKTDPAGYDFSGCASLFMEMIKNRVLVGDKTERNLLDALKMKSLAMRYDRSKLDLTIMVTEDCNFGCPYCYEKNKQTVDMIQVTIDGPPDIHNKKRFHLEQGDSFDVIQANLDRLMLVEKWPGLLQLNYIGQNQCTLLR